MTLRNTVTALVAVTCLAAGCAKDSAQTPKKTQLEVREFQTRAYGTNDTQLVMKAVFNVLQDEGFVVRNSSSDLGLLSASKEVHVDRGANTTDLPALRHGTKWKRNSTIDATVNVSRFGNECKVRVSFEAKLFKQSGSLKTALTVEDPAYYQRFFSKVDKGLFLQEQNL